LFDSSTQKILEREQTRIKCKYRVDTKPTLDHGKIQQDTSSDSDDPEDRLFGGGPDVSLMLRRWKVSQIKGFADVDFRRSVYIAVC